MPAGSDQGGIPRRPPGRRPPPLRRTTVADEADQGVAQGGQLGGAHRAEHLGGRAAGDLLGEAFDPARSNADVRLGTSEVWRLTSDFHHPVHLHLGHFRVLSRGIGGPGPYDDGPRDTIDLRPAEQATIEVSLTDYAGRYVFHCHNLEHEDMAMMGILTTR